MPQARYFQNPHLEEDTGTPSSLDFRSELVATLTTLVRSYPPSSSVPAGGGLYYGLTSIAYLFLSLANIYTDGDMDIAGRTLAHWAGMYWKRAQSGIAFASHRPEPSRCGIGDDALPLLALQSIVDHDTDAIETLCSYSDRILDPVDRHGREASNEWLYGRAGYLYLLRMVRRAFADDEDIVGHLSKVMVGVIDAMVSTPRPWRWHGKAYVGAVHGSVGIITQILLSDPSYAPQLEDDVRSILDLQDNETGNWPSSLESGDTSRLVQFCHGAPGVVHCLQRIRRHFPRLAERIEQAIDLGRQCIWRRGLLTKEPCLCHGATGNALALDVPQRDAFLAYTTDKTISTAVQQHSYKPSDDGEGLWTGLAGRAWVFAIADKGLPPRFLAFDDV